MPFIIWICLLKPGITNLQWLYRQVNFYSSETAGLPVSSANDWHYRPHAGVQGFHHATKRPSTVSSLRHPDKEGPPTMNRAS